MVASTEQKVIIFSIIMLFVTLYVAANLPERFQVGIIYLGMAVLAAIVYLAVRAPGPGIEFLGRTDWIFDLVFGIVIGAAWILIALFARGTIFSAAFSIGIPTPFSLLPTFSSFVVLAFAPILETLAFEGALRKLMRSFGLGVILTTTIVAASFSSFHLFAFTRGSYFAVASPFIAAFIFSLIAGTIALRRNNLLTPMIFHAIVNGFVLYTQASVA